jgi:uncharacterized membrane protein
MSAARPGRLAPASLVLASLVLAGCESSWETAACPEEGTELTYESFGQSFMMVHCQTCHASSIDDRKGAPVGISFDTREEVVEWIDRIYERSAGENVSMPPGPEDPSLEERDKLAEWLACGAP